MNKKRMAPPLGTLLSRVASKIGAKISLEPEWKVVGQIIFKGGKHSYFRYNTLDLNPMGSSAIAADKDYANFFMKAMGYSVIPGSKTFFSNKWAETIGRPARNIDAAYRYARKLSFPVIVKPNSRSQGLGVALVSGKQEFYQAVRTIFKLDRIVLVQKPVRGKDYRLVILDKKLISAYERTPLNIMGDGKSTIAQLLRKKQEQFRISKRDTKIKTDDPRIAAKLRHQALTLQSIPQKGRKIYLLDNANLSTGGDGVDVTSKVHPEFKKLAVKLTCDMGLRLCGVDLMVDGDIGQKPKKYWIIEINSAPGLDHYAAAGKKQSKIVENLYLEVLKHMER